MSMTFEEITLELRRARRKVASLERIAVATKKAACDKVRRKWVKDKQSMMLSYLESKGVDLLELYTEALNHHGKA